jgi:hypothetical protein
MEASPRWRDRAGDNEKASDPMKTENPFVQRSKNA